MLLRKDIPQALWVYRTHKIVVRIPENHSVLTLQNTTNLLATNLIINTRHTKRYTEGNSCPTVEKCFRKLQTIKHFFLCRRLINHSLYSSCRWHLHQKNCSIKKQRSKTNRPTNRQILRKIFSYTPNSKKPLIANDGLDKPFFIFLSEKK